MDLGRLAHVGAGRRAKYYRLTRSGRAQLRREMDRSPDPMSTGFLAGLYTDLTLRQDLDAIAGIHFVREDHQVAPRMACAGNEKTCAA